MTKTAEAKLERAKRWLLTVVEHHPRLSFAQIAWLMEKLFRCSRYMALKARRELEERARIKALARKNGRGQLYQVWVLGTNAKQGGA